MNKRLVKLSALLLIVAIDFVWAEENVSTRYQAEQNCRRLSGHVIKERRGDHANYDICLLMDNRQCETVAMLEGWCPTRGLKVTGLSSPQERYCILTGGSILSVGKPEEKERVAQCSRAGVRCDLGEYFVGRCLLDY